MPAQWYIGNVKDWETTCYRVETAANFTKRRAIDIEVVREWAGSDHVDFWTADGTEGEDITEATLIKMMDPICRFLVFQGLPYTGHEDLLLKNIEDVYKRLRLIGDREGIRPSDYKDGELFRRDITMDDLIKFVGIYNTAAIRRRKKVTVFCEELKISSKEWRNWAA